MTKPIINGEAGIYVALFEDEQIGMRFERFSEARDTVSAEVTVRALTPPSNLFWGRVNMLSSRSRMDAVKQLLERYKPESWKWDNLLEQACLLIMEKYREGEPVVMIGNLVTESSDQYRIFPLIIDGQANLIYGPGGIGKSNLACFLALLAQTGRSVADINGHPDAVNVLYLDYESSKEDLNDRIRLLRNGMGIPASVEIAYRYCSQGLANDIEEITRQVIEKKIGLVVVDSLGTACGGEPEAAESVLRYFAALRSLRIASLTISHTNKEGKLFGSVYTWNQARNIFEVKGNAEEDADETTIGLYHVKINRGKKVKAIALKFGFSDEAVTVTTANVLDIATLVEGARVEDRIEYLFKSGTPMGVREIAEEVESSENTVRVALNRGKDGGKFVTFKKDGRWLWHLSARKENL